MQKIKSILVGLAMWAAMLACTYSMVRGSVPHTNVLLFWVWAVAVLAPLTLTGRQRQKARAKERLLPRFLTATFEVVILVALAASGHFLSASAWLFAIGCIQASRTAPEGNEPAATPNI